MNTRQLIENEEDTVKDEMLDTPCYIIQDYRGQTYYLWRESPGADISSTHLRSHATQFSREEAVALLQQTGLDPRYYLIVPAMPVD